MTIKLDLIPEQIPIIAIVIEAPGKGYFVHKVKQYLKSVIDNTTLDTDGLYRVQMEDWVARWLLDVLYSSEVDGPAARLLNQIHDALWTLEHQPFAINDGE